MYNLIKERVESQYIVENFVDFVENGNSCYVRFTTESGMHLVEYRKLAKVFHFYKLERSETL